MTKCPFNSRTQLAEFTAWHEGYREGLGRGSEIWQEAHERSDRMVKAILEPKAEIVDED